MLELLGAVGGIVLVDLALSGDNALVIGAAAAGLPRAQRTRAIFLGGMGAVVLRIVFAVAATLLLKLPLLQAVGGLALLYIAARLLLERRGRHEEQVDERAELLPHRDGESKSTLPRGFSAALLTILVADVTMSLDNVLAIGALAHGNIPVLSLGLLVSVALVLAGSALVAGLIQRLPWLLDVAALVLGWTAAGMILHDLRLGPMLHDALPHIEILIYALGVGVVLTLDILLRARAPRASDN